MYYLGKFGTHSSSIIITVQERIKALKQKKINEIKESNEEDKINEENKEEQSQDIKRGQAKYIPSKYIL